MSVIGVTAIAVGAVAWAALAAEAIDKDQPPEARIAAALSMLMVMAAIGGLLL